MNSQAQPEPRHVLMTADTIGGVWTYVLELALALNAHGVGFTLATMGAPTTPQQRRELSRIPNVQLFESRYQLEWMPEPWDDVAAAGEWLLALEQQVRPDLVHLNGYAHGALPWKARTLIVGHSCVLSWWRAVHHTEAPRSWDRYRAAVAAGLQAADLVVAPSQAMLAALADDYGPLHSGRIIPNGRRFSALPLRPKEHFILTAGRLWDPAKNIAALDAVAPELPWPVYVAGDSSSPDGRVTRHRNVRHLGRLSAPDLTDQYARAAIYAFPARYEPFGLSVLEAALAGCALVLGDIPSLREIWNGAALFVPPDDPAALRSAIRELARDALSRASLGNKARQAAQRFTPEQMALGYLDAYRQILGLNANPVRLEVQPA